MAFLLLISCRSTAYHATGRAGKEAEAREATRAEVDRNRRHRLAPEASVCRSYGREEVGQL